MQITYNILMSKKLFKLMKIGKMKAMFWSRRLLKKSRKKKLKTKKRKRRQKKMNYGMMSKNLLRKVRN